MKLKTLVIVVAVLAALSAAVFLAQRPAAAAATDPRVGQALADRAAIEKAAKLRLSDQGKSVLLVRQPDATWRVSSYFDFPADFAKLSAFVASLTDAKLQRLVTTSADRIARLEFKDSKIELLDAADHPLWSLILGKNAESGGGRYVRFGQEDRAYLANLNVWLDAESKNWADSQLLNLKPEEIAKVELSFGEGGPVTVSRAKKEDLWTADHTPAGQRVKADKISGVLGSVGNVRFADTVEPTDAGIAAAKANQRVFKLTTFAGKTYTVALGRKPEEKKLKPAAAAAPPDSQLRPATAGSNPGPVATNNGTASPAVAPELKVEPAKEVDAKPRDGLGALSLSNGPAGDKKPEAAKPAEPDYKITPAGPVFVFIEGSDPTAPVNALMQKRAFKISDYTFTGLPQKTEEIFEPLPPPPAPVTLPAPAKPATDKPAADGKAAEAVEPKKG